MRRRPIVLAVTLRRVRVVVTAVLAGTSILVAGPASARVGHLRSRARADAHARHPAARATTHRHGAFPGHAAAGTTRNHPGHDPRGPRSPRHPVHRIVVPPDRATLRPSFLHFSREAGIPSDLAMALAWQESGWQRHKVSPTRAVGVMQLMPDTVDFVSSVLLEAPRRLDPHNAVENIRMGTRFLRYLIDRNDGDVGSAIASYYQGLRSVHEDGAESDTERYVADVEALRQRF